MWRVPENNQDIFFSVGDVECEIMFRLDDADDVANLNSLELTFAWFNECRDIAPEIIDAMSKRVGRFPARKMGVQLGTACGVILTRRLWTLGGITRWNT